MADALPKGIRKTPTGWQVYRRVKGQYKSRRFPPETTLPKLKEAWERLKAEVLYHVPSPAGEDQGFSQDARDYLKLVADMPSFSDREYRIKQWANKFGSRPRATITAKDIRTVLESWRLTGSHDGGPLTNASLNQRRTALMHMYTVLGGRSATNIVRDVPAYDEHYSQRVRAESMLTCVRLIRRIRPGSKMRAILYVLLWTGWPHALLKGVKGPDVDWQRQMVRLARRKKGQGMPPAWVPVLPRALIGLRRLATRGWLGKPFSNSSLHSALARAVQAENIDRKKQKLPPIDDLNPYAMRHSFATWAAGIIKDDRALKELLRTNSIQRYTEGALAGRLTSARDQLARRGNSGNS